VKDLQARTEGPVLVQLSPEIQVTFPVEIFFDERGPGYVPAADLGLSVELEEELTTWLHWWQTHVDPGGEEVIAGTRGQWRQWNEDGDRLLQRLREELGPGFQVRWV
jgi:hypothetical protein